MIVIKLGGSLLASGWFSECLDKIERHYANQPVVIVPGGGILAEQVRQLQQQWRFDDRIAHEMAILAMQQMALLIKGIKPDFYICHNTIQLEDTHVQSAIAIWSPNITELDANNVPANWQVTSDSLAAWLALKENATELIVVKSAAIDKNLSAQKLAEQDIVDPLFHSFVGDGVFLTSIIHAKEFIDGCNHHGKK